MHEKELRELGISKWDKLRSAVERGDRDEALRLVDLLRDRTAKFSNANIEWIDVLLTTLAERLGEDVVYEMMKAQNNRTRKYLWKGVSVEEFHTEAGERLKTLCDILTAAHGVNIEISEDEEKFTIKFPCDTGTKLIAQGDYGKTKQKYPWSHNEEGFCYYCSHCVVSWEMAIIEAHGYPAWISLPPKKPGEQCSILIYKDPKAIPEEYYKVVETGKRGGHRCFR
jgi:hypothetical protein